MNGGREDRAGKREGLRGMAWWGPSLAVLVGYMAWIGVGAVRDARVVRRQIEAARVSAPRPADIEAERVRGDVRARELAEARASMGPLREELSRLGSTWTNGASRLRGAEDLARLWGRHGLRLEEQAWVTGEAGLTPPLQQLVDRARVVLGKGRHPVLWEVRLRGSYMGMLGALEELAGSSLAAVPLSLGMRVVEGRSEKEWRLRLWQ